MQSSAMRIHSSLPAILTRHFASRYPLGGFFLTPSRSAKRNAPIRPDARQRSRCVEMTRLLVQQSRSSRDRSRRSEAARTNLPGGDFEDLEQLRHLGWQHIDDPIAGIATQGEAFGPKCRAKDATACELSAIRQVRSAPTSANRRLGRWSGSPRRRFARRPAKCWRFPAGSASSEPISGNIDGFEIIDSLGGPELALRVRSTARLATVPHDSRHERNDRRDAHFRPQGWATACVDGVMVRSLAARA